MSNEIFDEIHLKNGEVLTGIIDHVGKKFIDFIELPNENQYVYMIVKWNTVKDQYPRFSVYCLKEFPPDQLPPIKSINIKAITQPRFEPGKGNAKKKSTIQLKRS